MNQNFRENQEEVTIGQLVWYWRVSRASHQLKANWRGPARVVAIEQDSTGSPSVIWVAHGTSLLRCSPKQVRPMVEESGHPPQADQQAALQDLQALKARSTTQFRNIAQEPDNEIHADIEDQMDDYEPSIIGEDEQMVAPPMSSEIGRLIEINEDASIGQPSSSSRARSTGDAGLGAPAGEGKRRRTGSKTPATDKGAVTISEPPDAAPNAPPTTSTDQVAAVPVEVSGELMADEILRDEVSFDDVRFVSGDLPTGWTVVEGCLGLDEVWLTRAETKRRSEGRRQQPPVQGKSASRAARFSRPRPCSP